MNYLKSTFSVGIANDNRKAKDYSNDLAFCPSDCSIRVIDKDSIKIFDFVKATDEDKAKEVEMNKDQWHPHEWVAIPK